MSDIGKAVNSRLDAIGDAIKAHANEWQLVRFWGDICEDEPVQFYRAKRSDQYVDRWVVDRVDRWTYSTDELAFYGAYIPERDDSLIGRKAATA